MLSPNRAVEIAQQTYSGLFGEKGVPSLLFIGEIVVDTQHIYIGEPTVGSQILINVAAAEGELGEHPTYRKLIDMASAMHGGTDSGYLIPFSNCKLFVSKVQMADGTHAVYTFLE